MLSGNNPLPEAITESDNIELDIIHLSDLQFYLPQTVGQKVMSSPA